MNRQVLVSGVVVVLAVTCAVVALRGSDRAGQGSGAVAPAEVDPTTVEALRRQVARLESRIDELETAPAVGDGGSVEAMLMEALREPSPALDERIAAAVTRAGEREAGPSPGVEGKAGDPAEIAGHIERIFAELDRWPEKFGIGAGEVEELKNLTRRAVDVAVKAKDRGAGKRELTDIDVQIQAEVRRIVGDRVYQAKERERLHGDARGKLFWLSAAVGGLSTEQHTALDRAVEAGVEESLAEVVRLRSEPLPEQEYDAAVQRLRQAEADRWKDIRDGILTEEQRRRIPGK